MKDPLILGAAVADQNPDALQLPAEIKMTQADLLCQAIMLLDDIPLRVEAIAVFREMAKAIHAENILLPDPAEDWLLGDDSILHIEHPMGFKGEPIAHELALDTDIERALQQQLRDVCHNLE